MLFKVNIDGEDYGEFSTHASSVRGLREFLLPYYILTKLDMTDGKLVGYATLNGKVHTVECELLCECQTCMGRRE